jgi:putative pyruvate formate lyase activating enzyme
MDGAQEIISPGDALHLARATDYPQTARTAVKEMHRQVGDLVLDPQGLARRGLLVRHLVMPGGLDETRQIMRFLAKEVSLDTFVNVMSQYHPAGLASRHPAISRPLTRGDFREAVNIAREEGLRRLARE